MDQALIVIGWRLSRQPPFMVRFSYFFAEFDKNQSKKNVRNLNQFFNHFLFGCNKIRYSQGIFCVVRTLVIIRFSFFINLRYCVADKTVLSSCMSISVVNFGLEVRFRSSILILIVKIFGFILKLLYNNWIYDF